MCSNVTTAASLSSPLLREFDYGNKREREKNSLFVSAKSPLGFYKMVRGEKKP